MKMKGPSLLFIVNIWTEEQTNILIIEQQSPGWAAQWVGVARSTPKGFGFDSWLAHMGGNRLKKRERERTIMKFLCFKLSH